MPSLVKHPVLLAVAGAALVSPAVTAAPASAAGVASVDVSSAIDPVVRLAEREQSRHARRVVRLKRTNARLRGDRPERALRSELRDWSTRHLRRESRTLMRSNRKLRRRAARAAAAAPAAPPHLQAIAACESGGNPGAVDASGTYRGKYQFDTQTWASVGGSGDPAAAPEAEQDRRAAMLYSRSGAAPWPVCGR